MVVAVNKIDLLKDGFYRRGALNVTDNIHRPAVAASAADPVGTQAASGRRALLKRRLPPRSSSNAVEVTEDGGDVGGCVQEACSVAEVPAAEVDRTDTGSSDTKTKPTLQSYADLLQLWKERLPSAGEPQ